MSESVRLDVLVEAMAKRGTPVTPESGLFLVLESVDAIRGRPRTLRAEWLSLGADGLVTVLSGAPECSEPDAVTAVGALLDEMLVSMPASAIELMSKLKGAEISSVAALSSELEAMLVPLNRGAARRMLGRLVREHDRGLHAPITHGATSTSPEGEATEHRRGVGALLASAEPSAEPSAASSAMDTVVDPPRDEKPPASGDTVVDGRILESAIATDEDGLSPTARRAPSEASAWLMMAIAAVAVAGGAWFLYVRLTGH